MTAIDIAQCSFVCINLREQQCHVMLVVRHRMDFGIQPPHQIQHVSITIRFKPHGRRRRGHQEGGGNTFSGHVGNYDLRGLRVDGEIVIVIARDAPRGMHHSGYFEPRNGWFARGKKQSLDLCGQLYILEKVVTLSLNGFDKRFLPLDIALDHINNEGKAQQR